MPEPTKRGAGVGGPARSVQSTLAEKLQFIPSAGKLPPPDILAMYAAIDSTYPAFLQETFKAELKRNFTYQMTTWIGAILFASLLVCSATFLAYTDHPKIASAIVGVNLVGVVAKLLAKSRRGNLDG